jgi:hypothetical protein
METSDLGEWNRKNLKSVVEFFPCENSIFILFIFLLFLR